MSFSLSDWEKIAQPSKKHLLVAPPKASLDTIAALLAITQILKKLTAETVLFLPEGLPKNLTFLEENPAFITKLSYSRDFTLIFNTEKNPIVNIRTEQNARQCLIKITPKKGSIDPRDFSLVPADFSYDWLWLLGVDSLEKVGKPYLENPDLFFEVPKINLDNQTTNENYGQINWVEKTASSLGEILARFFLEKQPEILDQKISQMLLTAIVAGTESFQSPRTGPQAMVLAAKLMRYGINQTEIIRHLYRNKSLPFLKLWGKAMTRLEWEKDYFLVHSWLSKEDWLAGTVSADDLELILEEMQKNFPEAKISALFYLNEKNESCCELFFSEKSIAENCCPLFGKNSQKKIAINLGNKDFSQVKKEVLEKIQTASRLSE